MRYLIFFMTTLVGYLFAIGLGLEIEISKEASLPALVHLHGLITIILIHSSISLVLTTVSFKLWLSYSMKHQSNFLNKKWYLLRTNICLGINLFVFGLFTEAFYMNLFLKLSLESRFVLMFILLIILMIPFGLLIWMLNTSEQRSLNTLEKALQHHNDLNIIKSKTGIN